MVFLSCPFISAAVAPFPTGGVLCLCRGELDRRQGSLCQGTYNCPLAESTYVHSGSWGAIHTFALAGEGYCKFRCADTDKAH